MGSRGRGKNIFSRRLFSSKTRGQPGPTAVPPRINIKALQSPESSARGLSRLPSSHLPPTPSSPSSSRNNLLVFGVEAVFPNRFLSPSLRALPSLHKPEPRRSRPISPPYLPRFVPSYFILTPTLIRLSCPLPSSYFFLLVHPFFSPSPTVSIYTNETPPPSPSSSPPEPPFCLQLPPHSSTVSLLDFHAALSQ